jgi:RimJ/RimL family protein N-acetyltransferase
VIFVADAGDQLAGYVEAEGGGYRRTRHSAYVVIGVRRAWHGRGVGRVLLGALEEWAHIHGIRRLELTVRADNHRARRLYERAGYAAEGVRRGSLIVDEELVNEIAMARLL